MSISKLWYINVTGGSIIINKDEVHAYLPKRQSNSLVPNEKVAYKTICIV